MNLTLIDVSEHADSKNDIGIMHIFENELCSYKLWSTLT